MDELNLARGGRTPWPLFLGVTFGAHAVGAGTATLAAALLLHLRPIFAFHALAVLVLCGVPLSLLLFWARSATKPRVRAARGCIAMGCYLEIATLLLLDQAAKFGIVSHFMAFHWYYPALAIYSAAAPMAAYLLISYFRNLRADRHGTPQ